MGEFLQQHISFWIVFLEGVFSFFSPCVVPLIPVYMGYLAGSGEKDLEGNITFRRKTVFFHTMFFILGISVAFLILGSSFTVIGKFLSGNRFLFVRVSGILIILMGLFQLEVFQIPFLQKERRINFKASERSVTPFKAFLLGFTFSFAWTPCIGPALSSVLVLMSGAKSQWMGFALLFTYAMGFLIPFVLLGLFTTQILHFLQKNRKWIQYTVKLAGVLLILIGIMTFFGFMNGISSYLNSASESKINESKTVADVATTEGDTKSKNDISESDKNKNDETNIGETESDTQTLDSIAAVDFSLLDQNGLTQSLEAYRGKVVFLNFFATWCPPCNKELPDIQKLYESYGKNENDVVFLGVTNPKSEEYPNNSDEDSSYIRDFLTKKEYSFPVLFDTTGDILKAYGILAFPTTFIIDKEGNVLGYVPGMMTEDIMKQVIEEALTK